MALKNISGNSLIKNPNGSEDSYVVCDYIFLMPTAIGKRKTQVQGILMKLNPDYGKEENAEQYINTAECGPYDLGSCETHTESPTYTRDYHNQGLSVVGDAFEIVEIK